MNNRFLTSIIVLCFSFFFSCNNPSRFVVWHFVRTMDKVNDSLSVLESKWSKTLTAAVSTGEFGNLAVIRMEKQNFIDSSIKKFEEISDTNGIETLRKQELFFLRLSKSTIKDDYTPFEEFTIKTSMKKISFFINKLNTDKQIQKQNMELINESKKKLAAKYGVSIH